MLQRAFAVMALAICFLSMPAYAAKWYQGGTLQGATGSEWRQGSHRDKVATSADFLAAMYQKKMLAPAVTSSIGGVDDFKPFAEILAGQLDDVFQPDDGSSTATTDNMKVAESAVMLLAMMGWLKTTG